MEAIVILFLGGGLLCVGLYALFIFSNKMKVTIDDKIKLSDVIPIHTIEDDYIVNGEGDITIGFKVFLPEIFSLTEGDVNSIHDTLQNMLDGLPSGTLLHQQNFIYTKDYVQEEHSDNYLYSTNLKRLKGREVIIGYTNIYITFVNDYEKKSNPQGTSLLRKPAIPFKEPFNIKERIKDIERNILNIESAFSNIEKYNVQRLNSEELNNNVFDYINQSYFSPTKDATKEVVDPMGVTESGYFKIGNKLIAIVSLVTEGSDLYTYIRNPKGATSEDVSSIILPKTNNVHGSMIFPITYGLPFNHVVNVVVEVTDNEKVLGDLGKEGDALGFVSQLYDPAKRKKQHIEEYIETIGSAGYRTARTTVNIVIEDSDLKQLEIKTALAKQALSNMNKSVCYIENEEVANLFFAAIPGNAKTLYRGFTNTTIQALCYLLKEGLYLSNRTGHLFSDRMGNPVRIELWDNPALDNRNKMILGPSGSGKSFLTNTYILNLIEALNDIVIFDIGGSYRNLVQLNNGKYYDSRDKKQFQFNPFLCPKDAHGNYIYRNYGDDDEGVDDLIKTIASIIAFIWKEDDVISPVESGLIEDSIIAFFEHVNKTKVFPNLINYRKFIPTFYDSITEPDLKRRFKADEIGYLLKKYTEGELSYLLNATEQVDIINDTLIAYDMEDVKGAAHFPIIAMLTLSVIINKIKYRQGVRKTLIIDEALDFLMDEKFGYFIGYLFRTFRKKNGEIIIAAQNVKFILNAPPLIKDSILINSDTKIILEHGQKYEQEVRDLVVINMSKDEQDKILSLQRNATGREFAIKLGNNFHILQNSVSEECGVAFDSKQEVVKEIESLYNALGSIPAAINTYIHEHRRNEVEEIN